MKVVAIIPARMASTRFPGKPLAKIHGKSMIEHVYRRVKCAELVDDVYVATCDEEIANEVTKFYGQSIMTSSKHTRGMERVAEAALGISADIVINVQGDEPMIDPHMLDEAISLIKSRSDMRCLNMVAPIKNLNTYKNKSVVKVVLSRSSQVLYFSRAAIPDQNDNKFKGAIKQLGIYLIHKELLLEYSKWEESALEKVEKVDMLRFLENNSPIHTYMSADAVGVDTPDDLSLVERMLSNDQLFKRLFRP